MNSGTCTPRRAPPLDGNNKPTSTAGGKGRLPTEAERRELRECSFESPAGLELADNLQCQVRRLPSARVRFHRQAMCRDRQRNIDQKRVHINRQALCRSTACGVGPRTLKFRLARATSSWTGGPLTPGRRAVAPCASRARPAPRTGGVMALRCARLLHWLPSTCACVVILAV